MPHTYSHLLMVPLHPSHSKAPSVSHTTAFTLSVPLLVQERACYAIDAFCESLDKEILPYMPQLVGGKEGV